MLGHDPHWFTILVAVGGAVVFSVLILYGRLRWVFRERRDLTRAAGETARQMTHADHRIAAQRAQARAEAASGDERVAHLREAWRLWRLANQTRLPEDEATFREINGLLDMLEEQLAELGAEP
ncbi:MAG: hypothetical protein HYU66_01280 [Armatimonadetes bacterium]|nr:hypothetical protein [Armatimonadota bacterium]